MDEIEIPDLSLEKPDPSSDPLNGIAQDWCEERGLGRLPASVARTIFDTQDPRIPCENCGTRDEVKVQTAMTAYAWDGPPNDPEDPNRDRWFCPSCAEDYRDNWEAMWDEYYASRW